jgi:hypothetical protein
MGGANGLPGPRIGWMPNRLWISNALDLCTEATYVALFGIGITPEDEIATFQEATDPMCVTVYLMIQKALRSS